MPTRGAKLRAKRERRKAGDTVAIPEREPNGRPRRARKSEKADKIMQAVLNQPHRKGNRDQKCESALGRFCISRKLRDELFQAGEEYASAYRRWRLAKGLPMPGANGLGTGEEATPERVAALAKAFASAQGAIVDGAGFRGHQAVRAIVIEGMDIELTSESDAAAIDGLHALAIHYGLLTARRCA